MPPVFSVTVMAPDEAVFTGKARSLIAPGKEGYLGVLAHHAPMVVELGVGKLSIVDEQGTSSVYALSGGVLETGGNQVTVLADSAEPASAIDLVRAEAAEQRAQARLSRRGEDIDVARAQAALQRALNRIKIAREHRG